MQLNVTMPRKARIMEVGPRDGLQNEASFVDTQSKIDFIDSLAEAGCTRIEVTAFVSPRWIPPLADQYEVAKGMKKRSGVSYAALVPNVRGYERALSTGAIDEVSIVVAASDTHNIKNLNGDTQVVMERYRELCQRARSDKVPFRAYVSCAFGCPYEGVVPKERVVSLAEELLTLGAYELSISDTIGIGVPMQTLELLGYAKQRISVNCLALHMHDTRGTALANIFAGLAMGLSSFDASAGGLGGCPYAKGASGNVATEDLVNMLELMGIETGIDLEKLCETSKQMETKLHRIVPSKMVAIRRGAGNIKR